MKKNTFLLSLLFIPAFAFSQKKLEYKISPIQNNETIEENRFPRSRDLMQKSVAVTSYGAYHEIAGTSNSDSKVHLLLKETSSSLPTIRMTGSATTPANDRYWDIMGDVFGAGIDDDYFILSYGGIQQGFAVNPYGKASLGTFQNTNNLQIHEINTGTRVNLKMTNQTIGISATDGLDIGINNFGNAYIINQESGSIGINSGGGGITVKDANVGIGNPFVSSTTGKLEIFQNTGNIATTPHINLRTLNNASNGMIRMESSTANRYFGQYFNLNSATAANNFVSFDYNGTTPILDMQGNGNVKVSGFTTLGNDAAAPKIKMKKLSGIFSANANASGTATNIPHGVADPTKIITINVLGQYAGSGGFVSNSFLTSNGYQFDYQVDGVNIIVTPKQGNSASLVSQNIKVVITYEE